MKILDQRVRPRQVPKAPTPRPADSTPAGDTLGQPRLDADLGAGALPSAPSTGLSLPAIDWLRGEQDSGGGLWAGRGWPGVLRGERPQGARGAAPVAGSGAEPQVLRGVAAGGAARRSRLLRRVSGLGRIAKAITPRSLWQVGQGAFAILCSARRCPL